MKILHSEPLHFSDMLEINVLSKVNNSIPSTCLDLICPVNPVNKEIQLKSEIFIKQLPALATNSSCAKIHNSYILGVFLFNLRVHF